MGKLKVGIIGCGLIGRRRAYVASRHNNTSLKIVADIVESLAINLAAELRCDFTTDWRKAVADPQIDIIVISTPNNLLKPISIESMRAGKHVLIEKPMGCFLEEALEMKDVSSKTGCVLKVGFNHRYHAAILRTYELFSAGKIGKIINIRACYGHGGRPGYENEWRGNPKQAGGGELTDQGVHLIDLINWFAGKPSEVFTVLQTAVWPIAPSEDNAFAILKYQNGAVANFHSSWTQWKNLFLFEIFGENGSLTIEGIGGSYGIETLTIATRKAGGGVPDITREVFDQPDNSWEKEWDDFISHISSGSSYYGTPEEGVAAMQVLDALYKSSSLGKKIKL